MYTSQQFCDFHPQFQLISICTAKHQCQRKFCSLCGYKKEDFNHQLILNHIFQEQILEKFSKLQSEYQLSNSVTQFKTIQTQLEKLQEEIIFLLSNLKELINCISKFVHQEDSRFQNLLGQHLNPLECSNEDLQFLIEFLNENTLKDWWQKKDAVLQQMPKVIIFWEKLVSSAYSLNHSIDFVKNILAQKQKKQIVIQFNGLEKQNEGLKPTKFSLMTQPNGDKVYSKNGYTLRVDKLKQGQKEEQVILNLEQIKHLRFEGQYGVDGYKYKQWDIIWKGQQVGGGLYNILGEKEGKWIDLCENYWDEKKVVEIGYYKQDKRVGAWSQKWKDQIEEIGHYDNGIKIGKWSELSEGFWDASQVTYYGEYLNGKKVGRWDIMYKKQFIGGGLYDLEGNETKIGEWIELNDGFFDYSQVTYSGQYKNGYKVGRWDINYKEDQHEPFKQIGGGSYDLQGNETKMGQWTELSDGFFHYSQVSYSGQYKNGYKVGRWDINYKKDQYEPNNKMQFRNQIFGGGGSYDADGYGIKNGDWIELCEGFRDDKQVTYAGEYKNGHKINKWNIWYQDPSTQDNECIGGGFYEEGCDDIKIGEWIELSDSFRDASYITYEGQYKENKKFGEWIIKYREEQIGGGSYDERCNGMKIGRWIELSTEFARYSQIIYNGEYQVDQKVGIWDIKYRQVNQKQFKSIGGGSYDKACNGMKIGKWIELQDGFRDTSQIIYAGEYQAGIKCGRWDIRYREDQHKSFKQIGGGSYDEGGFEIKIGRWNELSDDYNNSSQVVYSGAYKNHKKIGIWTEMKNTKERGLIKVKEISFND
ncbi:unnamed protein product [Paramecium octaurelia]|uniref:MORN repeat protein n=1 Tax=Paramecium octaurelia TaxID=43137 RepID=A0A8S1WVX9_PAROT|nr:unnamed protein product [Paramecium octaurelia]